MSNPNEDVEPHLIDWAAKLDMPVGRLIGFETKEVSKGIAVVVFASGSQHANPMGTLHGGILCDIADAAME